MAEVFISYAFKDRNFVRKMHEALEKQERDTWIDWKDIPPTAEWWKEILTAIEAADSFVFVISPESAASATCREEVAEAMKNNKKIIPVVRRKVSPKDLPPPLADI